VDKTPAFRDAWKRGQRCLVITDGFYEWKKPEKQPYAIGMADDDLMVMAGLWDEWKSPKGEHIKSCTIITCPPNKVAGMLHDRMPVVLPPDSWGRWLAEEPSTPDELKALLVPCPDEALKIWPVDRAKIGQVRDKSREIADPVSLPA
jgi:putative SOS response-associated peptidase YedK